MARPRRPAPRRGMRKSAHAIDTSRGSTLGMNDPGGWSNRRSVGMIHRVSSRIGYRPSPPPSSPRCPVAWKALRMTPEPGDYRRLCGPLGMGDRVRPHPPGDRHTFPSGDGPDTRVDEVKVTTARWSGPQTEMRYGNEEELSRQLCDACEMTYRLYEPRPSRTRIYWRM